MGDPETRVERAISAQQHVLDCEGGLEKVTARWVCKGLREDIDNMSEEDITFNFLSGLQPWAQLELRRQKVSDLSSAIAAADGLADFRAGASEGTAGASSVSYPLMDRYEMKRRKKGLVGENLNKLMAMGSQKPRARKRFRDQVRVVLFTRVSTLQETVR